MNARDKARKLIALAVDERTDQKERRTAARQAVKLIHKYKLLDATPLDGILENEVVKTAKTVVDKLTDPALLGGIKELGRQFNRARGRR